MFHARFTLALPVLLLSALVSAQPLIGPRPVANPHVGLDGAASMHGDTSSSDTTPLPGPGAGAVDVIAHNFLSACPTILVRSDGKPLVLCTDMLTRKPVVRLLKRRNGEQKASLTLEAGSLLGGVYAFIDQHDRLVMVDGNQQLLRIDAKKKSGWFGTSWWELFIDQQVDLSAAVTGPCGGGDCDAVVSLSAGANGVVWFATRQARVGTYNPATGTLHSFLLAADERIDNSFSTTAGGRAAIATNRALYGLTQDALDAPRLQWRAPYDAGSARKPGQLSHGTGATPTFFGPVEGNEYVTITDNADRGVSLIVRRSDSGALVCQTPVFDANNDGTENSAIGLGNSVIVASTYGYPYPAVPEGAGPAVPENADFVGGMTRIDITDSGCSTVWKNTVRSAAVPKYSSFDGYLYTMEHKKGLLADSYHFTVLDPQTGAVLKQTQTGAGFFADSLQMAGNAGLDGVFWQGTVSGVVRVAPR